MDTMASPTTTTTPPRPPEWYTRPWFLIGILGAALMGSAWAWYYFSQPSETDVTTVLVSCQMSGLDCEAPTGQVVGPIVLAILGALVVLVAAIVWTGDRKRT